MPYTIVQREEENGHIWVVANATCSPDDPGDKLIHSTVALIRRSYSEQEILARAAEVMAEEIAGGTFQLGHLLAAIRAGMPDPSAEGDKPYALTTYRSQSAEMVAKAALAVAYQFEYPAAPQQVALNPNQPILGFDGWGLTRRANGVYTLVLIQVKATEEPKSPPGVARQLAEECSRIPRDRSALSRSLTVLALLLRNDPLESVVIRMLEILGNNGLPDLHVAPAIVRGRSNGQMSDLQPVRRVAPSFAPASARGIVVTIGITLTDFGEIVMRKARATT